MFGGVVIVFTVFVLVMAFFVASALIAIYNGLVSLKFQVERAWANIDVILKQRHDLIPQLVQICEQFTQYERGTIDHLVDARTKYLGAQTQSDKVKADQNVSQALRGFLAIGENYPVLKSSEQFLEIQKALTSLESQLADRREVYNEAVTNFNTKIMQFPDIFAAQILQFKAFELYKVIESDKTAPSLSMKLPA